MTQIRKGQAPAELGRAEFKRRFLGRFYDPACGPESEAIDRLVCADGGNPDPTTTHGKTVAEAKAIGQKAWDFPKHVAGRTYGVVVHGDVAGVEAHRRNLTDWLDRAFERAGPEARGTAAQVKPDRAKKTRTSI